MQQGTQHRNPVVNAKQQHQAIATFPTFGRITLFVYFWHKAHSEISPIWHIFLIVGSFDYPSITTVGWLGGAYPYPGGGGCPYPGGGGCPYPGGGGCPYPGGGWPYIASYII